MSEYAVWQSDAGDGTLLAAVAEAAFLIGLEKNRFHFSFPSFSYLSFLFFFPI